MYGTESQQTSSVIPRAGRSPFTLEIRDEQEGSTGITILGLANDPESNCGGLIGEARIYDPATGFECDLPVRIPNAHKITEGKRFVIEHKGAAGLVVAAGTVVIGSLFVLYRHHRVK